MKLLEGQDLRHWLGITAANEHFTAIFADFLLHNADLLGDQRRRAWRRCGCGTAPRSPSTSARPSTCTRRWAATTNGA